MKFVRTRSLSESFFRQRRTGMRSMANRMSDPARAGVRTVRSFIASGSAFYKKRGSSQEMNCGIASETVGGEGYIRESLWSI